MKSPSIEELERRIRSRGQNSEDSIRRRVEKAREQMEEFERHRSVFDSVCINDDFGRCVQEIEGLILKDLGIRK